ncbi:MAG: endonuclease III [Victivallaceae bacterium]|nr:endonuclease III [Victivallaceae bacterium]
MRKKSGLFQTLYDRLFAVYGECACPLKHDTPFQLLAAVMLSAQCRDERVNEVTRTLFAVAPDAPSMAALPVETVAETIRPLGLYTAKARNLQSAARRIVEVYRGDVPRTMKDLTSLAGIGRKSANVLLGNAFGIPGFPVDTHVNRVLNRIGAVASGDPVKIEKTVCDAVDPARWTNFSHLLIRHGRSVCSARTPACAGCPLSDLCRFGKKKK